MYRSTKQEVMAAYNMAPWLAPSMRGVMIHNTEHQKGNTTSGSMVEGCPKLLASAITSGVYDPLKVQTYKLNYLKQVCTSVNLPLMTSQDTKV